MTSDNITYSELTERAHTYLASARKAVDSMRQFLLTRHLVDPYATVAEFVLAAIACGPLQIRELPGQQEALGVALGNELAERLGWAWMCVTDAWGESLAVVAPTVATHAYPLDWIGKRLDGGGQFEDLPDWFEGVIQICMKTAAEAGPMRRG
jgi:hypothetical protein